MCEETKRGVMNDSLSQHVFFVREDVDDALLHTRKLIHQFRDKTALFSTHSPNRGRFKRTRSRFECHHVFERVLFDLFGR